jgi:hypothetical protein
LSDGDWQRPTIAGHWTVRDVVAHLLDTPLRRLSFVRDGWPPRDVAIGSDAELAAFVNAMNAEGVKVFGRLSPRLLIDFMSHAARQLREHLGEVEPLAPAAFPVSWAGETSSPHWFDVAREYTERWHHQAQIRLAVGALAPLMTARLYGPVIATFVRALPRACSGIDAEQGTRVGYVVDGEGGGTWYLVRTRDGWSLHDSLGGDGAEPAPTPAAVVRVPAALAWRLFTKGLSRKDAASACKVTGDTRLADAVLAARAIVA